jgi:hypothetical protein
MLTLPKFALKNKTIGDIMIPITPPPAPAPSIILPPIATPKQSLISTPKQPPIATPKQPPIATPKLPPIATPKQELMQTPKQELKQKSLWDEFDSLWLPPKSEHAMEVKITGVTPIGTVVKVPTSDERFSLKDIKGIKKYYDDDPDMTPILTASIYFDNDKTRSGNYVANKMRSISENTSKLQKQFTNTLQNPINVQGNISPELFEKALNIYENNQVYYQDQLDEPNPDIKSITKHLTELEHWFIFAIEPSPTNEDPEELQARNNREQFKLTRGLSPYCDPDLYDYITPITSTQKQILKEMY